MTNYRYFTPTSKAFLAMLGVTFSLNCGQAQALDNTALQVTPNELAASLPDIPRALLENAKATGDTAKVANVAEAAMAVFPDSAEAISAYSKLIVNELAPPEELAEEATPEVVTTGGFFAISPWEGKIVGTAARATGNSINTAYGVALDAARKVGKFTHNVEGSIDIASAGAVNVADSTLTQRRLYLGYQLDYDFSDRLYGYARASYEDDRFSGFDYRLFGSAGLGYLIYDNERLKWKVEGGPGYRYSVLDQPVLGGDDTDSQFAFYASSETDWTIRDGLLFEQDLSFIWTSSTSTFISQTAVTTAVSDSISVGASYLYRFETNPPLGQVQTDTLLRASVTYGF